MNKTAPKKCLTILVFGLLIVVLLISVQVAYGNSQSAVFHQDVIYSGSLEIIESPDEVIFSQIYRGDASSSGVLGVGEDTIRVRNHRDEGDVIWSLNLSPDQPSWSDGVNTFSYDMDQENGELVVDNLLGNIVIEGLGGCSEYDIDGTSGGSFADNSVIALVEAGSDAVGQCVWDISNISLEQYIPVNQEVGNYDLPMTLTVN